MITHSENGDDHSLVINHVNDAVLVVDASRPLACERESQCLGFPYASVGMLGNVGDEPVDFLHEFCVATLDEILVLLLRLAGENYSVHAIRFKNSSTDSSWP